MLSNTDIRRLLVEYPDIVYPVDRLAIQPASIDLHLSNIIKVYNDHAKLVDPLNLPDNLLDSYDMSNIGHYIIFPNGFILASTIEKVRVPAGYSIEVKGKSSLARIGLPIHMTAGHIDPGFQGQITLEIKNVSRNAIKLTSSMAICQISFIKLISPADPVYGHPSLNNHYQYQVGPTGAKQLNSQ